MLLMWEPSPDSSLVLNGLGKKKKKINLNAVLIPWHTAALTLPPHGGWQEVFEKVNPSSSNPLWVAAFLFIPARSCTMPHPLIFCPASQSLGYPLKSFRIHPSTLLVCKTLRLAMLSKRFDTAEQFEVRDFLLHWESLICLVCFDCAIRVFLFFSLQSTCIF